MATESLPDNVRIQQLEIVSIHRLKRGDVANVRWDEKRRVYVIEIAKPSGKVQ